MGIVIIVVVAIAVVGGLLVFYRAVFGGSTFGRERGRKDEDEPRGGPPGPRPDSHAGNGTWTGAGSFGRWNQWSGGGG
jgi:hypothetical protein